MKRSKLIVALSSDVVIFAVGTLFAIAEFQELNLLNNLKNSVPHYVFLKKHNEYIQLALNFLMLAIGGSLLSFSIIYREFYFKNRLYDKLSAIISLVAVFIINFFVEFDGIWAVFLGLTIIITFDCIFIFIKEEYDCLIAKKKAKKTE